MHSTGTGSQLTSKERFLIGRAMRVADGTTKINHAHEHQGFPSQSRGPVLTVYGLVGDQVWIQACHLSPAGVGVYEGPTMSAETLRSHPDHAPETPEWFEESQIPYKPWREQALRHTP